MESFHKIEKIEIEYKKLSWLFEMTLIMHKLARQYFAFRAFWLIFLPLTLLSTVTTILGFLSTGELSSSTDEDTAEVDIQDGKRRAIAIGIGVLGALATMVTAIGK